ncbi:RNA polymerase, 25-kDa subunit (common to polymerases I, II and III) [Trachipleistophora hominis]|uniref:DNA-directed RNA polymerases I, II, and III subunit RPABC1 n=1 Tax=Trachipleistophora hominis TaxID=72359 RepID=L7K0F6_TRAHO|nr:RNA polymerase, 25-kDa subunit (common to polymerases I, II and III) [Trachipleistophora hominis]
MTSVRNQYLVRKTVLEMLSDRGYSVKEYQVNDYDDFVNKYPNCVKDTTNLRIIVQKDKEMLFVFFSDEEKMSLKSVKILVENMEKQNIKNLILVLREGISPAANKFALECPMNITIFKEKELLFNVTKHSLVFKHRIISVEEKERLMDEKKIKEEQMPRILITDPVAKYLGARKGDVLEIERESETAGSALYWRRAV